MLAASLYLACVCAFIGGCIFAALCLCDPLGEAGHDPFDKYVDGYGDVPSLPDNLKTFFHATENTRGGQ